MKSRWPVRASLLGLGVASSLAAGVGCASLVGDFTLGAGTGGSGGSGSSMTGSSANSSASTSASTSGGGATASSSVAVVSTSPSATSSSSSSSGELDSGYHTCTPLVGGFPDETCTGVFVSSSLGSDAGTATGTMANPYATIGAALAASTNGAITIYVCRETFNEALSGTGNVSLYGGLDCHNGWQYSTTPTTLNGPADVPAVAFTGGSTLIESFSISAIAPSVPGGSSIGMAFGGSSLTLTNVSITTAPGNKGQDGMVQSSPANPGGAGAAPANGTMCTGSTIVGGVPGLNACETSNRGGAGGAGRSTSPAGNGVPGQQGSGTVSPPGGTGVGQSGASFCSPGANGTTGNGGIAGTPATTLGTLTSTAYLGPSASVGGPGGDGPGGGGGGGAVGCAIDGGAGPGGAGGGGGAGGCGGLPGDFGLPGGSSLGLILSASSVPTLTFTGVTITTANGGTGGNGAAGQAGGQGGKPGPGSGEACNGASGGNGGNGGNGPGGAGGHSIAIALTTALLSPAPAGLTVALGQSGIGGAGAGPSGAPEGPKGIACTVMSFAGSPAAGAACTIQ